MTDDSYRIDIAREDDYDQPQSLLSSLLNNISLHNVKEVWKVSRHRCQQSAPQYVIILDDGSHLCTCLWLINRGIACRHFFRVMSYSSNAQFHIMLIPQRWYNDKKYQMNQQEHYLVPVYQIEKNETDFFLSQSSFQHLERVRQTPNIKQLQGPKQKFGFGMGYAKKALDYAIRTDKLNELVSQLENFIEEAKEELSNNQENIDSIVGDPIQVKHKGRQPNRYKSGGELLQKKKKTIRDVTNVNDQHIGPVIQDFSNQKRARHCQKCKKTGHYAPRCPNI